METARLVIGLICIKQCCKQALNLYLKTLLSLPSPCSPAQLPVEEQEVIKRAVLRRFPANGPGGLHEHKFFPLSDVADWLAVVPDDASRKSVFHDLAATLDALLSLDKSRGSMTSGI
jgi:hypothetical protein